MTVYTYTGKLADYGGSPFPGARPELWVEAQSAGFTTSGIAARKRIPVTVQTDGTFSVRLEASGSVRPPAKYLLKCRWLDKDVVVGSSDWAEFFAPAGGGNIGELVDLPRPSGAIAYGYGPPPESMTDGFYLDISGVKPVLYVPEGKAI